MIKKRPDNVPVSRYNDRMIVAIPLLLVAGALLALWWVRDQPPFSLETLVIIRDGVIAIRKGHLRPAVMADLKLLIEAAAIRRGYVGIERRRVVFCGSAHLMDVS